MRPKEENLPDSLNEGRGRDPGDTAAAFTYMYSCESAQRRPGPRPRRHGCMQLLKCSIFCAQRRPGPRPRRHLYLIERMFFRMVRSTKAGAETPATPSWARSTRTSRSPLNEGRGRDPGDTRQRPRYPEGCNPLNEGRGRDPGDTRRPLVTVTGTRYAQRRPGPRPRRHSTAAWNALPIYIAQRRPGPRPRRHAPFSIAMVASCGAQRRPGPRPRRHPRPRRR